MVKKKVKGKEYFYLTINIKVQGKPKQFQIYAGSSRPTGTKLHALSKKLEARIDKYRKSRDPLLTVIPEHEVLILDDVKDRFKRFKKTSPAVQQNYYEWFITTFTYDSNAIEGSTLTEHETALVLFEGITPKGRPLDDVRAAENHKKAYDWMLSTKGDLSKTFILRLHRILTAGISALQPNESGKLRTVPVYIRGSAQVPPGPDQVGPQLKALLGWYKANKKRYHPAVVASYFHVEFERIHPFVDFNGRTGRLLLNFILLKDGYPPIDIRNNDRDIYYMAIRSAIGGDLTPFVDRVIKYLKDFLKKR